MPIPTSSERIGTCLEGRYELHAILARGGMGVLYDGIDRHTGRPVVVKLPRPGESDEAAGHARFVREAKILSRLRHPNVVEILGDGVVDGMPYFAMERLDGRPLSEVLLERGRLSPEQTLAWLLPIMEAVARAHDAGIIHRDLKPSNIFVHTEASGEETPKLLDFGIAKALEGETVTRTGRTVGTPDYMSPEQASGAPLDARSDVWSMTMMVYRCLSGSLPFDGPVYEAARTRVPLLKRSIELPSRFAAAVDRGLAFDPRDRYASMRDLAMALILTATSAGIGVPSSAVSGARGLKSTTSIGERMQASLRGASTRRRIAVVVLGCVVLSVAGMLAWSRSTAAREANQLPAAVVVPAAERGQAPTKSEPAKAPDPHPVPSAAAGIEPARKDSVRVAAPERARALRDTREPPTPAAEPALPAKPQAGLPELETQW